MHSSLNIYHLPQPVDISFSSFIVCFCWGYHSSILMQKNVYGLFYSINLCWMSIYEVPGKSLGKLAGRHGACLQGAAIVMEEDRKKMP